MERNIKIAKVLMLLCAISAFVAFITGIGNITNVGSDTIIVEAWRVYGFLVFSGLFALLAFFPHRYAGIWEIAIVHKVAMTITALLLIDSNARDAGSVALIDGLLVLFLIVSYILSKGYTAWGTLRKT